MRVRGKGKEAREVGYRDVFITEKWGELRAWFVAVCQPVKRGVIKQELTNTPLRINISFYLHLHMHVLHLLWLD